MALPTSSLPEYFGPPLQPTSPGSSEAPNCCRMLPASTVPFEHRRTFASQRVFYVVLLQDATVLQWVLKLDCSVKLAVLSCLGYPLLVSY
jgi:hypothetical protein